jgi:capsular polysaccharide biosynthesis protein
MRYSKIVKNNWEILAISCAIMVVLALVLTVFLPFLYQASSQILVIQKQVNNIDAYTASKSAERIAKNLAQVVYASTFYTQIINADSQIQEQFPSDPILRRALWKQNIQVNVLPETGILEISAFAVTKEKAALLANSVAKTLVEKAAEYHGGGAEVETKIIDEVFTSRYPTRPNIVLNLVIALLFGLIAGNLLMLFKVKRETVKHKSDIYELVPNENDSILDNALYPDLADEVVLNDEEED